MKALLMFHGVVITEEVKQFLPRIIIPINKVPSKFKHDRLPLREPSIILVFEYLMKKTNRMAVYEFKGFDWGNK